MDYTQIKQTIELPIQSCIINRLFIDAEEPEYHRQKYCKLNCGFRCQIDKTACYNAFKDLQ